MSRQDPGAAAGVTPHEPARCTCGCLITVHRLNDAGARTGCSNSNCDCTKFTEKEENSVNS